MSEDDGPAVRRRCGAALATVIVLAALAAPLVPGRALAATGDGITLFYVDKTSPVCRDTGAGLPDEPFCTVAKGLTKLAAGRTLYIGNGTYAETVKVAVSGTSAAPVTVAAWPGRTPTVGSGLTYGVFISSRSYVSVSGLTVTGTTSDGIYVSSSSYITIAGNTVTLAGQPSSGLIAKGISLRSSYNSVLNANLTTRNSDHGILVTGTSSGNTVSNNESSWNANGYRRNANGINVISPGNTVIRNLTHDNEDSGLQFFAGGDNNLATLNVTYNNGDHGIDDYNVTGGRLIGNTVYRNCTSGINVEGTSGNYVVANNVAVDNAVYPAYNGIACSRRTGNIGIYDSAPATTKVDHNLVYLSKPGTMYAYGSLYTSLTAMQAATGQEKAGVQGDPKFVAPASWNLRTLAGSAAIDRGDSGTLGAQATDYLGMPRVDDPAVSNQWANGPRLYDDLGAYEFTPDYTYPPVARLAATPSSGLAPIDVVADASGSVDPQSQQLTYRFDFGDATPITDTSTATISHRYSTAGSFTLTLIATNTSGLSATATAAVVLSAPQPPVAVLSDSPTVGIAPALVTADGTKSTDPQGQPLTFSFDFGDGTARVGPQPGGTASHTYRTAGSFIVTLTVVNAAGLSSTASDAIKVEEPPPP